MLDTVNARCTQQVRSLGRITLSMVLGAGVLTLVGCARADKVVEGQGSLESRAGSAETSTPPSKVRDLTKGGCPPELLRQAQVAANWHVISVRGHQRPWSSAKLFTFWTDSGKYLEFMLKGDTYIQINSESGIGALSDLFEEYQFSCSDFADPEDVHWFLKEVANLYGDSRGARIGSSVMLRITEADGGVELWLEGTEKNEDAFLELCRDPHFLFDGSKWEVAFHVFKQGGSVEKWEMKGEHDLKHECNKIHAIDITLVKPKGTFYHEVMF